MKGIFEVFSGWAAKSPSASAAEQGSKQLCYSELESLAIKIANGLVTQVESMRLSQSNDKNSNTDAQSQPRIMLLVPSGWQWLAAVLACQRQQFVYVPIFYDVPEARLKELLNIADIDLVITTDTKYNLVESLGAITTTIEKLVETEDYPNRESATYIPENTAYFLFTSGTSAAPKCVSISNKALHNYLNWAASYYEIDSLIGSFAQLSPAFDASVTQLLVPLISGKSVRFPNQNADLHEVFNCLSAQKGAVLLKFTPSELKGLITISDRQVFDNVSGHMVIGGEQLTPELVPQIQNLFPQFTLHNEYGPTETTVGCSVYTIKPEQTVNDVVPIGKAIANTKMYLVDDDFKAVPAGQIGEIVICGDGVAQCYFGNPSSTEQVFLTADTIPALSCEPRQLRVYRSGDLAYVDTDNEFIFVGRKDNRKKIRGHRVGIEEVESAIVGLNLTEAVSIACVGNQDGDLSLLCFFIPKNTVSEQEFRQAVNKRLPDYMVPNLWRSVANFPLNSSGKVNQKLLLEQWQGTGNLEQNESKLINEDVPSGSTEDSFKKLIVELWRKLLGHHNFCNDDSFFASGGSSLHKIRLVSAIKKAHPNLMLNTTELMNCQTVNEFCSFLADAKPNPKQASSPVNHRPDPQNTFSESRKKQFPLSVYQEAIWLSEQRNSGGDATYHMPSALLISGKLDVNQLHQAFKNTVPRHGAFYTNFEVRSGLPVQILAESPKWQWTEHPISENTGKDIQWLQQVCDERLRQPFDLQSGCLLRIDLFPLQNSQWLLFVDMHHLLSDEWSTNLLIEEVCQRYNQAESLMEATDLSAYGEFAVQQRNAIAHQQLPGLLFWQEKLSELTLDKQLPGFKHTEDVDMQRETLHLTASEVDGLKALSNSVNGTLNSIVSALLAVALSQGTRLTQIRFGSPVADRQNEAFVDVVGYFLNTIVQSVPVERGMTFKQVAIAASDELGMALLHSQVPYSLLKESANTALGDELFQCRYIFSDDVVSKVSLQECHIKPVSVARPGQKYPLLVSAHVTGSELQVAFDFNAAVFSEAQVKLWRDSLSAAATAILENSDTTLASFSREFMNKQRQSTHGSKKHSADFTARRRTLGSEAKITPVSIKRRPVTASSDVTFIPKKLQGINVLQAKDEKQLLVWLEKNKGLAQSKVDKEGIILFRGFDALSAEHFEQFLTLWSGKAPSPYLNRSTPRSVVHRNIYTSTEYPATETIPLHNENAYSSSWPKQLALMCQQASQSGGQTPVADSRKIFNALPEQLRNRFMQHGIKYIRNYSEVGLSWEETFQTSDKKEVERYCVDNGVEFTWLPGNKLRTEQIRPAALQHPVSNEWCWFNQAHLFHVSNLDAETQAAMQNLYPDGDYPRTACLGNGEDFKPEELALIRQTYIQHKIKFDWQDNDIILVDNVMYSHGREPYIGDRKVLVGMVGTMSIPALIDTATHSTEQMISEHT